MARFSRSPAPPSPSTPSTTSDRWPHTKHNAKTKGRPPQRGPAFFAGRTYGGGGHQPRDVANIDCGAAARPARPGLSDPAAARDRPYAYTIRSCPAPTGMLPPTWPGACSRDAMQDLPPQRAASSTTTIVLTVWRIAFRSAQPCSSVPSMSPHMIVGTITPPLILSGTSFKLSPEQTAYLISMALLSSALGHVSCNVGRAWMVGVGPVECHRHKLRLHWRAHPKSRAGRADWRLMLGLSRA